MKKTIISLSLFLFSFCTAIAQVPQKMSYQAIIRNAGNNLVVNTSVGMRFSILQTTATGTAVYVETQTPATNANGLVSLEIGSGTVVSGTMATIDWNAGPYFIKTETDPAGGTAYTITGTTQLLSVPYAMAARPIGPATGDLSGNYPNPKVVKLNGTALPTAVPTFGESGKTLRYNYNGTNQYEYANPVELGESISPGSINLYNNNSGIALPYLGRSGSNASLIPVCYGTYNAQTNTLVGNTSNVVIQRISGGNYALHVTGAATSDFYTPWKPIISLTTGDFCIPEVTAASAYGYFNVQLFQTNGYLGPDYSFSFVVYNK